MASKSSIFSAVRLVNLCSKRNMGNKKMPYFRVYKHRRDKKRSDLDIQQLLYGNTEAIAGIKEGSIDKVSTQTQDKNNWTNSRERLKSLKTTELMVGIFAVLSMIGGYLGLRWIASNAPKFKEKQVENMQPKVT